MSEQSKNSLEKVRMLNKLFVARKGKGVVMLQSEVDTAVQVFLRKGGKITKFPDEVVPSRDSIWTHIPLDLNYCNDIFILN